MCDGCFGCCYTYSYNSLHIMAHIKRFSGSGVSRIAGVCAGIAYYEKIPVWDIRVLFLIIGLLLGPIMIIVYFLLWFITPLEFRPNDYFKVTSNTEE